MVGSGGRHVLVVGGGGREHALAWGLARSPSVAAVTTAPGNPGTARLGATVAVDATDPVAVADLATSVAADLVVIGPEAPLVAGVVDELDRRGIVAFGPTAAAARLEGSKAFAKEVMAAAGAPTARAEVHADPADAVAALDRFAPPYVVKADGLAAGKGVRICATAADARAAVTDVLERRVFGAAGDRVVLEDFLDGPEASVFAVADGADVALLSPARDFKRARDADEGPNTGGMGAYTPIADLSLADAAALRDTVFLPVLDELARRGSPYRGLLYAGLVLTADGPRLLEFNCRFGDPETQVVVPRLASDLGELLTAAAAGAVADVDVAWHEDAFVTVVLASGGYPGAYDTGLVITGVEDAEVAGDAVVFHAGTAVDGDDLVTAGGRVLAVTGRGADVAAARTAAYRAADRIRWPAQHRRDDIAAAAGRPAPVS